ncbi:MAG: hypothetical protein VYA86_03655 [Candidatus Thermoplasmatota archaeon]|nr:hypothetical protein [Candidatus Thermoplasmatota archaeon]
MCSEEIPEDSLFCPECGARQDPSNSGAMGGRNFGVVSSQAVQATHDMQASDAAGGAGTIDPSNFLNQIAGQMAGDPAPVQTPQNPAPSPHTSVTDQVVDHIVQSEKAVKADARNEWLAMNQQTASGVLAGLAGGEVPSHLATSSGSARFLDDGQDVGLEKKRAKSNQPSTSLLRRMAEVATRRVARKRGVAVESPQVALTDDDTIQVNVTYIDDGRVLDTPPDLSNAFEHAIATEMALKGFDIGIEISLFRSMDGDIELVWGESADSSDSEDIDDDEEELFACDDCGHYPIRESDTSCAGCGAQFIDDDDDDDYDAPAPRGGPPSRGPSGGPPSGGPGGAPSRGPSGGPGGPPRGPSRGPSGGPPSRGPGGGGPPSRGPGGGGPPSRGPSGSPPSRGPGGGGPPSRGPGGGGPPSRGPSGGPPSRGSKGGPPKRKGPPR